jgi:hypothetical protein
MLLNAVETPLTYWQRQVQTAWCPQNNNVTQAQLSSAGDELLAAVGDANNASADLKNVLAQMAVKSRFLSAGGKPGVANGARRLLEVLAGKEQSEKEMAKNKKRATSNAVRTMEGGGTKSLPKKIGVGGKATSLQNHKSSRKGVVFAESTKENASGGFGADETGDGSNETFSFEMESVRGDQSSSEPHCLLEARAEKEDAGANGTTGKKNALGTSGTIMEQGGIDARKSKDGSKTSSTAVAFVDGVVGNAGGDANGTTDDAFTFEMKAGAQGDQSSNEINGDGNAGGGGAEDVFLFEMETSSQGDLSSNPVLSMEHNLSHPERLYSEGRGDSDAHAIANTSALPKSVHAENRSAHGNASQDATHNSITQDTANPSSNEAGTNVTTESALMGYGTTIAQMSPQDLRAFLEFADRADNRGILKMLNEIKRLASKSHGTRGKICWEMTEISKVVSMDPTPKDPKSDAVNNIRLKVPTQ